MTARELQKIAITDLAFHNTDRHLGNILYSQKQSNFMQIDHALVLPKDFMSEGTFAWASWPAAHYPFTEDSLQEISAMNFKKDRWRIKTVYPHYPEASLEVMEICYYLLKEGAAIGLTPFQISLFYQGFGDGLAGNLLMEMWKNHAEKDKEPRIVTMKKNLTVAMKKIQRAKPPLADKEAAQKLLAASS